MLNETAAIITVSDRKRAHAEDKVIEIISYKKKCLQDFILSLKVHNAQIEKTTYEDSELIDYRFDYNKVTNLHKIKSKKFKETTLTEKISIKCTDIMYDITENKIVQNYFVPVVETIKSGFAFLLEVLKPQINIEPIG